MDRSESQFKDSNFFCVEEKEKDIEYLYVYILVEKFAVDRVAFACFVRLLNESNLVYKNLTKKNILEGKYFSSSLDFSYDELPYNYILKCKVKIPSNLDKISRRKLKLKVDLLIKKVLQSSWTKREADLDRVKDEIRYEENNNSNSIVNKLRHLFYLNFDKKFIALSYDKYGLSKDLDKLKRISLEKTREVVSKSQRMVFFYGDSEYKRMLNIISYYKPSPKIFPVYKDDSSINTIKEIISSDVASTKGLVVVFEKPKNNNERNFILNRLVAELYLRTKKNENGFISYDTSLYDDYLRLYYYATEMSKDKIKSIVENTLNSEWSEKEYEAMKADFKLAFENKFYSIDLYFEFLAKMRLMGFSTERQTYLDILDSITHDELIRFIKNYRYVSLLATELKDNTEIERMSEVKFDLKLGKIKLIEDEMSALYLAKACSSLYTCFTEKLESENLIISPLKASVDRFDDGSFLEISFVTNNRERVYEILKKEKLFRVSKRNFMRLRKSLRGKLSEKSYLEKKDLNDISHDKLVFKLTYKKFKEFITNVERLNNSIFLAREEGKL